MTWLINIIIVALIFLTVWFFFMKRERSAVAAKGTIAIKVQGGYNPSVIEIPVGVPTVLAFERLDPTSCLEEIVIPDFKIRQYLPLNQTTAITLTPKAKGEYKFHCGMSMFFGKIVVV